MDAGVHARERGAYGKDIRLTRVLNEIKRMCARLGLYEALSARIYFVSGREYGCN